MNHSDFNYDAKSGKYITIKGTKLYYEEYGKGQPLLMLHGGFGNIANFKKSIPFLSEKFYVIAPDAPGHGRSDFPEGPIGFQIMAEYYSELIDELKLENINITGWSDGGISGLLLAKNRPDKIKKLLVCGSNYKAEGDMNLDRFKDTLLDIHWVEENWHDFKDEYKKYSPTGDWKRYITEGRKMWMAEEYFPKSVLEGINIPVMLVYGDMDSITPEHGLEIRDAIKNCRYKIIAETGHDIFNQSADQINKIAVDFFEEK